MTESNTFSTEHVFTVALEQGKQRLDHFLVRQLDGQGHSRSSLNKLIQAGQVSVNATRVKPGYKLQDGDQVRIVFLAPAPVDIIPEPIDFSVLFEDDHILVIVKPPGLVVHPAPGHSTGTLVNGLVHYSQNLAGNDALRPGIVHRLDKDTSGIMLVAKTDQALRNLTSDFKNRLVSKTYHALLQRMPHEHEGRIVAPLGRHPVHRKKMAIRPVHGKYAASSWHVQETYANGWCLAKIQIETGRTHQIRVHMASVNAPLVGDQVYGGKHASSPPTGVSENLKVTRQMLHASQLVFRHPISAETCTYVAPLWQDMADVVQKLQRKEG